MSRIEQALEKAIGMRESSKLPPSGIDRHTEARKELSPLPEFQIRESIIDPSSVNRHVVCITDPGCPAAEQYRKLRARILSSTRQDFKNTLMISSADAGEGKSITSVNLAVALAQEFDHTVLLVDADMRKPSIHKYLGIQADRGLSDYLSGTAELSEVLINTGIGKLVILPAGPSPSNPAELISSNRMKELVTEMKYRYKDRYIIFDSAPILAAADSISLSHHVDGLLLVVQAARTSERVVKKALGLVKGVTVLGVVYNNVPDYLDKLRPYNYYYYAQGAAHQNKSSDNGNK